MLTGDQKRTGSIFIGIFCLAMKMIPAILWVYHFDQDSKMQSKQWKHPGSPPPKKYKRVHSAGKVMASIFWSRGDHD